MSLEYEANVASPQGQPALALSVAWAITTHEFVIWNLAMAQGSKHARNATRIRSFHPGNGGKFKSFVLQTKSGRLTNGCGRASGAKARQARVAFTSSSCHKPCLCTGKLSVSLLHVCILLGVQSVVASSNQVRTKAARSVIATLRCSVRSNWHALSTLETPATSSRPLQQSQGPGECHSCSDNML